MTEAAGLAFAGSATMSFCGCLVIAMVVIYTSGKLCEWFGLACAPPAPPPPAPTTPLQTTPKQSTNAELKKYTKYKDRTVRGADVSQWIRTKSVTECAARCSRMSACKQFVVSQKSGDGYTCWLKRSGSRISSPKYSTYVKIKQSTPASTSSGSSTVGAFGSGSEIVFNIYSYGTVSPAKAASVKYPDPRSVNLNDWNQYDGLQYDPTDTCNGHQGDTPLRPGPFDNVCYDFIRTDTSRCDWKADEWRDSHYVKYGEKAFSNPTLLKNITFKLVGTSKRDEFKIMQPGRTCKQYIVADDACNKVVMGDDVGDRAIWKLVPTTYNGVDVVNLQSVACSNSKNTPMYLQIAADAKHWGTAYVNSDVNNALMVRVFTPNMLTDATTTV